MAAGAPPRLIAPALVLGVGLALSGCAPDASAGHAPGWLIPPAWTMTGPEPGDSTAVLWTFRTSDCLTCMAVDYDVRRVQARFGRAVPLIAVHVGRDEESAIPRAYFRTRRLRVDRAVTLSPRAYRELSPDPVLPALYLVQGRRIVWASTTRRSARTAPVPLANLVQRLRGPAPPAPSVARIASDASRRGSAAGSIPLHRREEP